MADLYCWCGHLQGNAERGHRQTADGIVVCDGVHPPNRDSRTCKCDQFVPIDVANFRMLEALHNHVLDFKLMVAAAIGLVKEKEEPLIKKVN